jgi:hypothetical protein
MMAPLGIKYALLGFGAGALISVLIFPLNFLLALILFLWMLVRVLGRAPDERAKHWIAAGVALTTVAVAIVLPVKQLDGRVGPFRYGRMSLDELCVRLGRDHHVLVSADRATGTNLVGSFTTDRAMTKREVLEKLAREATCDLHIGYCGTGATLLFGAHPSFTRLHSRAAQPGGAANRSQPLSTNRTSSAIGSGG